MKTQKRPLVNRAPAQSPDFPHESEFREVVDLIRAARRHHADLRDFERRNLFRMRQFYDAYKGHRAAAPLIRTLSWSSNRLILSRCKSPEEREFNLRLAHREGWDKRETDRQLRGALFERAILARPKVSPAVTLLHPDAEAIFNRNPWSPSNSSSMNSSRKQPLATPTEVPSKRTSPGEARHVGPFRVSHQSLM